jgi:hypothetical protein
LQHNPSDYEQLQGRSCGAKSNGIDSFEYENARMLTYGSAPYYPQCVVCKRPLAELIKNGSRFEFLTASKRKKAHGKKIVNTL